MRFAVLALCLVSPAALGDASVPPARSAAATCTDADWPALRRAVARYCDALTKHDREELALGDWCEDVRRRMAGCPKHLLYREARELTLIIDDKCEGYYVTFAPAFRRWKVTLLASSAEDPC